MLLQLLQVECIPFKKKMPFLLLKIDERKNTHTHTNMHNVMQNYSQQSQEESLIGTKMSKIEREERRYD